MQKNILHGRAAAWLSVVLFFALSATARAAITRPNPVTGETESYTWQFVGTDTWKSTNYWENADGEHPAGVPAMSGENTWDPILFDGSGININAGLSIEGWNLRMGLYNGASVTMNTFVKYQGDTTMWMTVDETSQLTIGGFGGGNITANQAIKLSVAKANGITWNVDLTSGNANNTFEYYLAGPGSVSNQVVSAANHKIKQADVTLSGGAKSVKSKTLVSFTSSSKTFTADATIKRLNSTGTDLNSDATLSTVTSGSTTLTTESSVGDCELVQTDTGIVLYWVDGDPAEMATKSYNPSININFTNGSGLTTAGDVGLSGYEVPGTSWNNFTVANNANFNTVNAVDATGAASVVSDLSVAISGTRGSWSCSDLSSDSNPLHGYIDESSANMTPTVTVAGIPYYKYRAIVYHSTDTANKPFGYDTINGTDYTYADGVLTEGTDSWGDSGANASANDIAEGGNVLVTGELTGSTLTVVGHRVDGDTTSARGCIAAIQIVEIKDEITENDLEISVSGDTVYPVDLAKELTGTVYLTGSGTLTLDGSAKISAAAINVGSAVTLNVNADRLDATIFTGAGTVAYTNAVPQTGKGWTNSTWTGTVWIKDKSGITGNSDADTGVQPNSLGNSHSKVKFSGVSGWVEDITYAPEIVLENEGYGYALQLTNGNSPAQNNVNRCTIIKKLSGSGTLGCGGSTYAWPLLKVWDATGFSGSIDTSNAGGNGQGKTGLVVVFCSEDTEFSDTLYALFKGEGTYPHPHTICVMSGETVTQGSAATWNAVNGFVLNGKLVANGTLASSASAAVAGAGTVVFGGAPSPTGEGWWTNSVWTGTVELNGVSNISGSYTFNDYGNAGSTVKLTNCSGWLKNNYTCVPALEIGGTFSWNDGSSGLNNAFKVGTLKGSGTISIPSGGAATAVWQVTDDWSEFTGPVIGNNTSAARVLVFGPTLPSAVTAGEIYVSNGATLDLDNSSSAWWGVGMGFVADGTVKASARTKWGGGTTMTLGDTGVLELVTGSDYVNDINVDYSNVTGTGTVRYSGSNWRSLPNSTNMFATTLSIELENDTGVVFHGGNANGSSGVIGGLFGTKNLRTDLGGYDKVLTVKQAKDGVWSGLISAGDRLDTFVVDPGESSTGTLTLAGTHTSDNKLTVNGSVNLTGTWVGNTTVAGTFGGTGTLTGDLTFSTNSTFKAFSSDDDGLAVSGTITYPDEGTITVDVSALTPDEDVALIAASGLDASKFKLADGAPDGATLDVEGDVLTLKVVALPTVTITVPVIANTTITVTVDGKTKPPATTSDTVNTYTVIQGKAVTITYTANSGYEISGQAVYNIASADADQTVDASGTSASEAAATYVAWTLDENGDTIKGYEIATAAIEAFLNNKEGASLRFASTTEAAPYDSFLKTYCTYEESTVTYTRKPSLTLNITKPNCTVTKDDETALESGTVNSGDTIKFKVVPNSGYTLTSVTSNGNTLVADGEGYYTVVVGDVDVSIVVTVAEEEPASDTATVKNEATSKDYDTLAEALAEATSGQTLRLLTNNVESVTIPSGVTVKTNGKLLTGTISGAGTITASAKPTTAPTFDAENWTGTYVADWAGSGNFNINTYGTSNSVVRVTNIANGYVSPVNADVLVAPTVEVSGTMTLNNGYSGKTTTFRRLTGGGTVTFSQFTCNIDLLDNFTGTLATANGTTTSIGTINLTSAPVNNTKIVSLAEGASVNIADTVVTVNGTPDASLTLSKKTDGIYVAKGVTINIPKVANTTVTSVKVGDDPIAFVDAGDKYTCGVMQGATVSVTYTATDGYVGEVTVTLENATDGATVNTSSVTVSSATVKNETANKYYTSLATALAEAQNGDTVKLLAANTEATVSIPEGVTLTTDGKGLTGTISGTGVFEATANMTPSLADGWAGTFRVAFDPGTGAFNPNAYGTANSVVEIVGSAGVFRPYPREGNEAPSINPVVVVAPGTTWTISNGWDNKVTVFSNLSGSGDLIVDGAPSAYPTPIPYTITLLDCFAGTLGGVRGRYTIGTINLSEMPAAGAKIVSSTTNINNLANTKIAINGTVHDDITPVLKDDGIYLKGPVTNLVPYVANTTVAVFSNGEEIDPEDEGLDTVSYIVIEGSTVTITYTAVASLNYVGTKTIVISNTFDGATFDAAEVVAAIKPAGARNVTTATPYLTLAEALSAVHSGEVVRLLASNAEDVTIPEGVTLNTEGYDLTGTISGAGTIVATAKPVIAPTFDDAWTGMYVADWAGAKGTNFNINQYGTTNSVVRVTKLEGGYVSLVNGDVTVLPTVDVSGKMTLDNGYVGKTTTFSRLIGSGVVTFKDYACNVDILDGFTGVLGVTNTTSSISAINRASVPGRGEKIVSLAPGSSVDISTTCVTTNGVSVLPADDLRLKADGIYRRGYVNVTAPSVDNTTVEVKVGDDVIAPVNGVYPVLEDSNVTVTYRTVGNFVFDASELATTINLGSVSTNTVADTSSVVLLPAKVRNTTTDVPYLTYNSAITAAKSGDVLTLLTNIVDDVSIPSWATVNTNGKAFEGSVAGNGVIEVTARPWTNITFGAWSGTVKIVYNPGNSRFAINEFGTDTSIVEIVGNASGNFNAFLCDAWAGGTAPSVVPAVVVSTTNAWAIANGWTDATNKFSRLSGNGSIFVNGNGAGKKIPYEITLLDNFRGTLGGARGSYKIDTINLDYIPRPGRRIVSLGNDGAVADISETILTYNGVQVEPIKLITDASGIYVDGGIGSLLDTPYLAYSESLNGVIVTSRVWSATSDHVVTNFNVASLILNGAGDNSTTAINLDVGGDLDVGGAGLLSFWWKASSEMDIETGEIYDYGYLALDGVPQGYLDDDFDLHGVAIGGMKGWTNVVFNVVEDAPHTISWVYVKDEIDELYQDDEKTPFDDRIYLDQVYWLPRVTATFDIGGDDTMLGVAPASITNYMGNSISMPTNALPVDGGFDWPLHTFQGWVADGVTNAVNASFTMPWTNLTFNAAWTENRIVTPMVDATNMFNEVVTNGCTETNSHYVTMYISTPTPLTEIYYTLNGTEPTTNSLKYTGPFALTNYAATVLVRAFRDNYFDSDVYTNTFTRLPYTFEECLGLVDVSTNSWDYGAVYPLPGISVTTDATLEFGAPAASSNYWQRVIGDETVTRDGVGVKSGKVGNSETNWIEVVVSTNGTLTFWWQASSEAVRGKVRDGALFFVDGVKVDKVELIGQTNAVWRQVSYTVTNNVSHTFRWTYGKSKRDGAAVGQDCAWLDDITWQSGIYYLVTFDANGGTFDYANDYERAVFEYAKLGDLPSNTNKTYLITRGNYTLEGWFAEDGSQAFATNIITGNATYKASWIATLSVDPSLGALSGDVFGDLNGTTNTAELIVRADQSTNSVIGVATRAGYTFDGWFDRAGAPVYDKTGKCVTNTTYWTGDGNWQFASNLTVYAQWTANSYDLTFDFAGGTNDVAQTNVTFDAAMPEITPPTRMGYTFGGYFDSTNGLGTLYYDTYEGTNAIAQGTWTVPSNLTVYAQWVANTYEIAFDQGPVTNNTESTYVTFDAELPEIIAPDRTGYTFGGYFAETNGVGTQYFTTNGVGIGIWTIPSNITAYAQWTANEYVLTFDFAGGTNDVAQTNVTFDAATPAITAPTRTGYTFNGYETAGKVQYYDATAGVAVATWDIADDTTLFAQWTANVYTLTFDFAGGTNEVVTTNVTFDAALPAITAPTRTGYTFDGYSTVGGTPYYNVTTPAVDAWDMPSNTTLVAQWTPNTYTVTLDQQEGVGGTTNIVMTYDAPLAVDLDLPEMVGYTFQGYYFAKNGGVPQVFDAEGNSSTNDPLAATFWAVDGTNINWVFTSDIEFYANWTPNVYALTFDFAGGTNDVAQTNVTFDAVLPTITVPTRTGYAFGGYYDGTNGVGRAYYDKNVGKLVDLWDVPSNTTVYAKWAANKYAVSFDFGGGTNDVASVTATFDGTMPEITAPTRTGYTFGGYYDKANGEGKQYYNTYEGTNAVGVGVWDVAAPTTLFAKWTANKYDVELDLQSGAGGTTNIVAIYDAAMPAITAPTRTGYTFGGYEAEDGEQYYDTNAVGIGVWNIPSNTTLFALWTANDYTVNFDQGPVTNGTLSATVTYDAEIESVAEIPVRRGYTFQGYRTADETTYYYDETGAGISTWNIASDTTLYAKWKVNSYEISFNRQNGAGGTESVTATYDAALAETIAVPVRKGYTFGGYYTRVNGDGEQVFDVEGACVSGTYWTADGKWQNDAMLIVYAKWTANVYDVAFDQGPVTNGTLAVKATYDAAMPTITKPTRTGYAFGGYYTEANGAGKPYYGETGLSVAAWDMTNSVTTLYAKWTANTYVIEFDRQGGTSGSDSVSATYDSAVPDGNMPTRSGYTFNGYFTEKNGGGVMYYDADGLPQGSWNIASSTKLYASWTAKTYEIAFDLQGGEGDFTLANATYDDDMPTIVPPTRTGYTFTGYYTGENGTGTKYYLADGTSARTWNIAEDTTLYAYWKANTYTVTFDRQNGTGGTAKTDVVFDSQMARINMPTRTGYTLNGYFTEIGGAGVKFYNANGTWAAEWNIATNTTLYASWTANAYTVTFDRQNGTGGTASTGATYDAGLGAIDVPTRRGYTFGGYYTGTGGTGTMFYDETGSSTYVWTRTGDIKLFAMWTANTYDVTLDAQGGEGGTTNVVATFDSPMPIAVVASNDVEYVTMPTMTGYTFGGYFTEVGGNGTQYYKANGQSSRTWNLVEDTTLYAKWTVNSFRLTLDRQGGLGGDYTTTVTYGSNLSAIATPVREGYTFDGYATYEGVLYYDANGIGVRTWDIDAAKTLYAQWTANTYDLILDQNGGAGGSTNVVATYDAEMPAITLPLRKGYTFDGYYFDTNKMSYLYYNPDGTSAQKWIWTIEATLTAHWTTNSYTVSFDGTTNSVVVVFNDRLASVDVPERTGYSFAGYYTGEGGTGTQYFDAKGVCTRNWGEAAETTLYAKWTANTYDITFDQQGGFGGTAKASAAYESALPTIVATKRPGYTFGGYFDSTNGLGKMYYDTNCVSTVETWTLMKALTLYASWSVNTYLVTLDWQDDDGTVEAVLAEYDAAMPEIYVPVRTGYRFDGYFTEKDEIYYTAEGEGVGEWDIAEDTTLYAKWSTQSTVAFITAGGVGGTPMVVAKYDQPLPKIKVPVREGYTFEGYYTEAGGEGVKYYNADGTGVEDWNGPRFLTLYAAWSVDRFDIVLHKNDGSGTTLDVSVECGEEKALPGAGVDLKWAPRRGFTFMGWATAEKSKTVYLKDKADVKNLLEKGETIDLYAIWQLKTEQSYAIQYIRNDGSGMVRTVGFVGGVATNLNSVVALGFARRGYEFGGWATSTENARNKVVWKSDMGIVSQPVANGNLLPIYAIWTLKEGYYTIRFNKNDGSGAWRELGYEYGKNTTLPTIENGLGWAREGYTFVGWMTKTEMDKGGSTIWRGDAGVTKTPVAAGKTLSIYAVWAKDSTVEGEALAVCTGRGCSAGAAPAAKTVEALLYFADDTSMTVEARIESDGFTVVELGDAVYCGYVENGAGELVGSTGGVWLLVTSEK